MKIALHPHLYYQDQLPEMLKLLENLNRPNINVKLSLTDSLIDARAEAINNRILSIFPNANIERAFGAIIEQQNYQLRGIDQSHYTINFLIKLCCRFFYQKKLTKSDKTIVKICKIPVYSQEVAVE